MDKRRTRVGQARENRNVPSSFSLHGPWLGDQTKRTEATRLPEKLGDKQERTETFRLPTISALVQSPLFSLLSDLFSSLLAVLSSLLPEEADLCEEPEDVLIENRGTRSAKRSKILSLRSQPHDLTASTSREH